MRLLQARIERNGDNTRKTHLLLQYRLDPLDLEVTFLTAVRPAIVEFFHQDVAPGGGVGDILREKERERGEESRDHNAAGAPSSQRDTHGCIHALVPRVIDESNEPCQRPKPT